MNMILQRGITGPVMNKRGGDVRHYLRPAELVGAEKKIYGFIRTGGKTYCFLGNTADFKNCGIRSAEQTALSITAFSTDCEFTAGKARLKISFISPLPPDDLELLSLPVCYMKYEIEGDEHAVMRETWKLWDRVRQ